MSDVKYYTVITDIGRAQIANALIMEDQIELTHMAIGDGNGSEVLHVGIMAAAKRVDTTGAGDFYAAGFLAGLCRGLSLRQCGTIGAITAGKVIEVVGTTFGEDVWEEVLRLVHKVETEKYLF